MNEVKKNMMCKILLIAAMIVLISPASGNLEQFLEEDKTNEHEFLPWYTCGHFTRDLVRNASAYNITLGSAILSNHPTFQGRGQCASHILNYIMIDDEIHLIEPQTDQIKLLNQTGYKYYRLYHEGIQVPSNWDCNLAHTGTIE